MRLRSASKLTEARLHDGGRIAVVQQRKQKVLERSVFVVPLVGIFQRAVQCGFETLGECGHGASYSFSIVHCSGCWF